MSTLRRDRLTPVEREGPAAPPTLPPGFEFETTLGRGGMGVVYRARQVNLGRTVALKMILAGRNADEMDFARFRTEAEAIATLQHPHIVQLYEIGDHAGVPYFTLEYCRGGSLQSQLRGAPVAPRPAAHLMACLADAVQAAHDHRILHRDLKPANVLLQGKRSAKATKSTQSDDTITHASFDAAGWTVKISDFGLAKKLDTPGQTETGAVVGTPCYMAPQQAAGQTRAIGPTADIYALGAILYELLTGRPPFRAASFAETVYQVIHVEPVPPAQLNAAVPRDLQTICLKCLEKSPSRRYETAADLADDLRRFERGEPIAARPIRAPERAYRWCRRHPGVALSLTAVAVTLIVGTIVSWSLAAWALGEARRADDALVVAKEQTEEAKVKTHEANAIAAKLKTSLEDLTRSEGKVYAGNIQGSYDAWTTGNGILARRLLDGTRAELRGWEYHCLKHLYDKGQGERILRRVPGTTRSASLSGDGRRVAAITDKADVLVLDTETGENAVVLKDVPKDTINCVRLSRNGHWIAAGGDDLHVRVWNAATGELRFTSSPKEQRIIQVAVSNNGKYVAAVSNHRTATLWNVETGADVGIGYEPGNTMPRTHLAFDAHDKFVFVCRNATFAVWDLEANRFVKTDKAFPDVLSFAVSGDGRRIVTGSKGHFTIWDGENFQPIRTAPFGDFVNSVAMNRDGDRVVTGANDKSVKVWTGTGAEVASLKGHRAGASVSISDDGAKVATAGDDTLRFWNLDETLGPAIRFPNDFGVLAAVSRDGQWIACSGPKYTVQIWKRSERTPRRILQSHRNSIQGIVFSNDGARLATASTDKTLRIWDVATGAEIVCIDAFRGLGTTFSPDGSRVAGGGINDSAKVWDARTGKELLHLPAAAFLVIGATYSADGSRLVTFTNNGKIKVWDAVTGRELFDLPGGSKGVTAAAFSPDGALVATGGWDNVLRVFDGSTGKLKYRRDRDADAITAILFTHDGSRIVSSSTNGTIRVRHAATGDNLLTLQGHDGKWVTSLGLLRDDSLLVSGGADGAVRTWPAPRLAPRKQ